MGEEPREPSLSDRLLEGIPTENLKDWIEEKSKTLTNERKLEGFELGEIEGSNAERNITLVKLKQDGQYPQHIHKDSDAVLVIINGNALFLTGKDRIDVKSGDKIEIPRNMPHGFELPKGEQLEFLSVQSPPIRNPETGEEDLHNIELKDLI